MNQKETLINYIMSLTPDQAAKAVSRLPELSLAIAKQLPPRPR